MEHGLWFNRHGLQLYSVKSGRIQEWLRSRWETGLDSDSDSVHTTLGRIATDMHMSPTCYTVRCQRFTTT